MSKYNTLWEYVQKISIKNQTDMFEKMGDKAKVLEKGEFTNYSRACLKTHSYILHAPICSFQTHPSILLMISSPFSFSQILLFL